MSRRPAGKTSKSGARTPKAKAKSASVPSGGTPDKKVDGRASDPVLPKRSFTMLPIAQTGLKAARTAFHQRGFGGGALFEHWAEIVGPRLAARSCPEKLTRDRRTAVRGRDGRDSEGGTLHVKVSGGPAALEFQTQQGLLVERLNMILGRRLVARIRVTQGRIRPPRKNQKPKPPPLSEAQQQDLAARVETVTDPELQAVLSRLGESILRRGR